MTSLQSTAPTAEEIAAIPDGTWCTAYFSDSGFDSDPWEATGRVYTSPRGYRYVGGAVVLIHGRPVTFLTAVVNTERHAS